MRVIECFRFLNCIGARLGWIEIPIADPTRVGFGYIEAVAVRRENDSVRRAAVGENCLRNDGTGGDVIDAGNVAASRPLLAPIGEPEAAGVIEGHVIRTAKP